MARKSEIPIKKKTKILEQLINGKINRERACHKLGICLSTLYEWKNRYLNDGESGLEYKSNKPKTSPSRISDNIRKNICQYAMSKNRITSFRQISRHFREQGILVSDKTVKKILRENGIKTKMVTKDGRSRLTARYDD